MRWSSVFNLLPRLFPANDIQVTAAERGLLAFEAMNEVHEPAETVFRAWDEDAIALLKKDPDAYFRITREMRRDTPERRQAMRGALLAAQTDTERSIASLKESRWCQVHHETMFWCQHLHEGSAPVSPTVERVPSVSVTPPDTEGTTKGGYFEHFVPVHHRKAEERVTAAMSAHYAKQVMTGDYQCPCGEQFAFESDWLYHLGEMVADELSS